LFPVEAVFSILCFALGLNAGRLSLKTKIKMRMITAMERNATEVISFSAKNSENLNFFLRDPAVNVKLVFA
jgi:hypothetical protein